MGQNQLGSLPGISAACPSHGNVAQLAVSVRNKSWAYSPAPYKLGIVVHTCNLSGTQETQMGGPEVQSLPQGQPGLHKTPSKISK